MLPLNSSQITTNTFFQRQKIIIDLFLEKDINFFFEKTQFRTV